MKKQKGRRVPGPAAGLEAKIQKLEAMHSKVAGLLHVADQQDTMMRRAASAHHDVLNAKIAEISRKLEATWPNIDPKLARAYAKLLQDRKVAQATILSHRGRKWDEGHAPPL